MNENTINNDVTMAGESERALLANRYRIIKQLGQGGMGSVWLAEDTQLDGKLFAIKMLPSILVSNKRAYNQLKSEALVAMKLVHPNIVQMRAFEENDGNPFLVMDYIDGETLDDWLGDGELGMGKGEEDIVCLLKPIAEALDYAHTEGVVHRDIKPANVMIRKDGRPFIMDFGIAREIQETMTRVTGKMSSGTLMYMSPEQLNGDTPKPSQDVYSFAAMVYECIKGEPPFSRGAIEDQIKNKVPEPLLGNIAIASSILAGLSKKPEDRPKSCVAVLDGDYVESEKGRKLGVRNQESGRYSPVGDLWEGERPRDPRRKSFGKIAAIGLLALGLVGGVWYWQDVKTREEARIAVEQKAEAERKVAEEARVAAEKVQAEKVEAEAMVKKDQLLRIDDKDGFQDRKTILSNLLTKATAYGNAKQWDKAALNFANYVEGCNKLITLDGERKAAKEKYSMAFASQRLAANAESSKYASARWGEALDVMKKASEHFSQMKFSDAKGFYESAANQFKLCISEAENERERQVLEALATNPGKVLKKDFFTPKLKKYEWICAEISRVQGELSALLRTFTEEFSEVQEKRKEFNELFEQFVTLMEKDGLGDKARKALKSWAGSEGVIEKPSSDEPSYFIYEVKRGDTLARIAKEHQTTFTEIIKVNKIRPNGLWVGQKLKIPLLRNNDRPEKRLQDWEKLLNRGYKPGPTNQGLDANEEARCLSLIRQAFYSKWVSPAWTSSLKKMYLSVQFGPEGKVVGYSLTRSSGDASADRTVLKAASQVSYVSGLSSAFLEKHKEIIVRFEVTPPE